MYLLITRTALVTVSYSPSLVEDVIRSTTHKFGKSNRRRVGEKCCPTCLTSFSSRICITLRYPATSPNAARRCRSLRVMVSPTFMPQTSLEVPEPLFSEDSSNVMVDDFCHFVKPSQVVSRP